MNDVLVFIHFIAAIIASVVLIATGFCYNEIEGIKPHIRDIVVSVIVIWSLIFGLYKIGTDPWTIPEKPYATVRIVALNDNNLTSGRFYIRRGYFDESLYYQYMKRSGSGFKAGKVKADKTTLYYAPDENYRVECYEKTKKWLYFEESAYYYKIYIPEGSIAEDYIVDLE